MVASSSLHHPHRPLGALTPPPQQDHCMPKSWALCTINCNTCLYIWVKFCIKNLLLSPTLYPCKHHGILNLAAMLSLHSPRKSKLWSQCWIMTRLARTMPLGRSWWEASPQGPGWNTGPTCWPTPVAPSPSGIHCSQRRRWMPPSQPWMPRSKLPPEHIVPTSTYLPMHFPPFPQVPHISVYSRRTPQMYICSLHPPLPLLPPPFKRSIDTIQHDGIIV